MWFLGGRANYEDLLKIFSGAVTSIDDAVERVAVQRAREITLIPWKFGQGTLSGLWVACTSTDYIVYPDDAFSTRKTAVITHELAHMLLQHEPQGEIAGTDQLVRLLAPTLDPSIASRILARHAEDTPEEAEAERLGTQILARLSTPAKLQDPMLDRLLA